MTVIYQVPAPGAAWIEEERNQLSLIVDDDGAVPLQRSKLVRRRVEVLASTDVVTRARVTYLEHTIVERRAVLERTRPSLIAGKSYVLETTIGGLAIARSGSAGPRSNAQRCGESIDACTLEEEAAVRAEERRFGQPTLGQLIARQRFELGAPVAVSPSEAARLFPGELEITALELTLLERGDDAQFALRIGLLGAHAGIETRADAAGTLRVAAATAQPREMKVVGPVRLTGALVAEGTLELVSQRTPA
jgi:hypothetical protein